MGLSHLIYPGALHTRFHHSIGTMHLAVEAIQSLRMKGHTIPEEELTGLCIAMLLHDLGHGPYSHNLEGVLLPQINHEEISLAGINHLNKLFGGALERAIAIYTGQYEKAWLNQLVSGQLDLDRLDYLRRDSFYTGVSEGTISVERILKMLNVTQGNLVIEEKGIYSIEKFIVARRLMYWQVYLHKTVLAAETMLANIIRRARELIKRGHQLDGSPLLLHFLTHSFTKEEFQNDPQTLALFMQMDDVDIFASIKLWQHNNDKILSYLSTSLVNRRLFRTLMKSTPFEHHTLEEINERVKKTFHIEEAEATKYLVTSSEVFNSAYNPRSPKIRILEKDGTIEEITSLSEQMKVELLHTSMLKHYLCFPKNITMEKETFYEGVF